MALARRLSFPLRNAGHNGHYFCMPNARNYLRTLRNSFADLKGAIRRGAVRKKEVRERGESVSHAHAGAFMRSVVALDANANTKNTNPFGGVK